MIKKIDDQSSNKTSRRKKKLIILSIIFLSIGLGYYIFWSLFYQFVQSTDNAYVMGNQIPIHAQISGGISSIYVDDNDLVMEKDVIAQLESIDAENNFGYAKNELAKVIRETQQIKLTTEKLLSSIQLKQVTLDRLEKDLVRRENLWSRHVISQEEIDHARQDVSLALNDLNISKQELKINNALLMQNSLLEHPNIQKAIFKLKEAWLNLKRIKIVSPVTGYVSKRQVQIGAQVNKGERLFVIVPLDQVWVEANFKEVQLKRIRIGQKVTLTSDYYGSDIKFDGIISGIAMGTGSVFSLLPAQNATGNWIKVIQRLPVRIELNKEQIKKHPLRLGLSMEVKVDTSDISGKLLTDVSPKEVKYQTDVLSYDSEEFEQLIREIMQTNLILSNQ
ncbi:efflux RND transporter periplasmic adaptor subunit [Gilliamella sp. B2776]|uniref:HlyD family secretion protein n=2 Tax=Gilliamella TaxID=1193503 RepID=UPI00226A91D7|nr:MULTISPECIES: efflux RND transporter periplasmic adaptor subunit [unclassified Gilliamella]MCX8649004.1 efflux RND transporter periplasmic adaptor subunit [Gilliamella sp. B2779]MCX8653120.1 efflux RND transporter periplasmic adaptor subunit [Gilliamella sp. B2737]MCX8664145.1 efflux RND transporter periplasmic adaptor subunit [Gilliamella sp. B2887]MCX8690816.1 efflux RND transporter periplasmic adaptor subunit [Gilliamella sp. B2776]MCX8698155.1 efflux RND transporter periplasmic adaptor 